MLNKLTKQQLIVSLKELGIQNGDNLFVISDLANIGYLDQNKNKTLNNWIEIFDELVGVKGGYMLPAYNKGSMFFKTKKKFNKTTETYCGSFSNFLLNNKNFIRSKHPLMSVVGKGEFILPIIEKHDHKSLSYTYLNDFIKLKNSKILMLGTYNKTHFPQTLHLAQENLGITKKNIFKGIIQIYFVDEHGRKRLYKRYDYGGCTRGAFKLYPLLIKHDILKKGLVGNSISAIVDAKKSYDILLNQIKLNPKIYLCDNKNCIDCFGNPYLVGIKSLSFFTKKIFKIIKVK